MTRKYLGGENSNSLYYVVSWPMISQQDLTQKPKKDGTRKWTKSQTNQFRPQDVTMAVASSCTSQIASCTLFKMIFLSSGLVIPEVIYIYIYNFTFWIDYSKR